MLLELHRAWAWFVIIGNGLAGVWALAAYWLPALRQRLLWWFTIVVEVAIFVQAGIGTALVAGDDIEPPEFHLLYGFSALVAVGILYSYRTTSPWVKERAHLMYGLGGLFLMGLAIRAFFV